MEKKRKTPDLLENGNFDSAIQKAFQDQVEEMEQKAAEMPMDLPMPEEGFEELLERMEKKRMPGRKRWKGKASLRLAAAVAAVLTLSLGTGLVSMGERLWRPEVHENSSESVVVEINQKDDHVATEKEIYEEIEEKLGIAALKLQYKPEGMELSSYMILEDNGEAWMYYLYEEQIVTVYMSKNFRSASAGIDYDGEEVERISSLWNGQEISIVKRGEGDSFYLASQLEYGNAYYYIMGKISENEFVELVNGISFSK